MLCLMRLRFNLSLIVLADIFKVSTTSASTVFHSVPHALYIRTKPFINWPERDCLHRAVEFKKYFGNKVTVNAINDCFEVFIERPSSLQNLPASLVHHILAQVFTTSHDTPKRDYPDTAQLRNGRGRDAQRDALPLLAFLVLRLHRLQRLIVEPCCCAPQWHKTHAIIAGGEACS